MSLGRRSREQQALLVSTTSLPRSPGHPFYGKLNRLLGGRSSTNTRRSYAVRITRTGWVARGSPRGCTSGCCSSGISRD